MERSLLRDMNCAGIDSKSYDAIKKFVETEEGAKLLTFGEQLQENVRMYDAPTWYEWACESWGSKWNAREPVVDTEMRVITFETAWSAPGGIVKALAERFPNIGWKWVYADEDQGYNVGRFIHGADFPEKQKERYRRIIKECTDSVVVGRAVYPDSYTKKRLLYSRSLMLRDCCI